MDVVITRPLPVQITNSIRRAVISKVKSWTIIPEIHQNKSILDDDMLSHRLNLIPCHDDFKGSLLVENKSPSLRVMVTTDDITVRNGGIMPSIMIAILRPGDVLSVTMTSKNVISHSAVGSPSIIHDTRVLIHGEEMSEQNIVPVINATRERLGEITMNRILMDVNLDQDINHIMEGTVITREFSDLNQIRIEALNGRDAVGVLEEAISWQLKELRALKVKSPMRVSDYGLSGAITWLYTCMYPESLPIRSGRHHPLDKNGLYVTWEGNARAIQPVIDEFIHILSSQVY